MTYLIRNMSSNSASKGVRCITLFMLLALAGFGLPTLLVGADEQSGPFLFTSSSRTAKDIQFEAKARRELRQDAQLKSLNLCVEMNSGVATLSGPVPSVELKQRAIQIVQRVEGVLAVTAKDLYISTNEQAGERVTVVVPDDRPIQTRSASPGSPSQIGQWNRESARNDSPSARDQQITLLAPETAGSNNPLPPSRKLAENKAGGARLTGNPHPLSPAVAISLAVEQLRQREARYQQIRARVQGTTVYLFPGATASEDAMTFAQAVRRLPGVQHVILSTDPH